MEKRQKDSEELSRKEGYSLVVKDAAAFLNINILSEIMGKDKVIVLGLDGLSWNVIREMMEEGKLRNIKRIIDKGSSGRLRAEPPLISPVIWTSIFTGKKPEKHGIKDFFSLGKDLKSGQIWDILNKKGYKNGIYRPWSGWNVKKMNGFFIPGFFSFENRTHPKGLEFVTKLDKKARKKGLTPLFLLKTFFKLAKLFPIRTNFKLLKKSISSFLPRNYKEKLYRKKEIEFLIHTNLFLKLLKEKNVEFSVFYDNSCDFLSHNYWEDMKKNSKFSNIIPEMYEKVDKFLGKINRYAEENSIHLLIISDHGFKSIKNPEKQIVINIPKLLKESNLTEEVYGMNVVENGILRLKPNSNKSLSKVKKILNSFKCKNKRIFEIKEESEKLVFRIKDFVRNKRSSKVKTPKGKKINIEKIVSFGPTKSGDHCEKNGVFLIKGNNIKEGEWIGNIEPYDVTPTLLSFLEVPISVRMNGRVLKQVFKNQPEIRYTDEKEVISPEEKDLDEEDEKKVKERLKSLGYL